MRRRQITRVFLESDQPPYLSLQFWLLWCIESHQKQERRRHQRPLEDDSKTAKRKCEEVLETERVRLTLQSTSFSLDLLKRIKTDGRQHRSKVWRSNEVTCPSVLCARGGSFLFCINVLNVHPRWPAGSPILPRGTRDVIWKTRQIETMEGQSCLSTFICCRLY